jgi:hypothetical protein
MHRLHANILIPFLFLSCVRVVTAATGTSLMNGSNFPDFSVVPSLVSRLDSPVGPSPTGPDFGPHSALGLAAQAPLSSVDEAPPPWSPPAIASPSSSPPAPPVTHRRSLLSLVRQRLFRQGQPAEASGPTASTDRSTELHSSSSPSFIPSQVPSSESTASLEARPTERLNASRSTAARRTSIDHQDIEAAMQTLRASLTRQLTQALMSDGDGFPIARHAGALAVAERDADVETIRSRPPIPAQNEPPGRPRTTPVSENPSLPPPSAYAGVDPISIPLPPDDPTDFNDVPPSSSTSEGGAEGEGSGPNESSEGVNSAISALLAVASSLRQSLANAIENEPTAFSTAPATTNSTASEPAPTRLFPRSPVSPSHPDSFPRAFATTSEPTDRIIGYSGATQMSFQEFLTDIQRDLRSTLESRVEVDRERARRDGGREHRRRSSVVSSRGADIAENAGGGNSSSPREESSIHGRHLEDHVPSVSLHFCASL